jgi:Coenzyme PQQ synthesis protein D (PqqD)
MNDGPLARRDGLVVKTVGDEVLVYDLERARAHSLDALAAALWHQCDGRSPVAALAAAVRAETGVPVTPPSSTGSRLSAGRGSSPESGPCRDRPAGRSWPESGPPPPFLSCSQSPRRRRRKPNPQQRQPASLRALPVLLSTAVRGCFASG